MQRRRKGLSGLFWKYFLLIILAVVVPLSTTSLLSFRSFSAIYQTEWREKIEGAFRSVHFVIDLLITQGEITAYRLANSLDIEQIGNTPRDDLIGAEVNQRIRRIEQMVGTSLLQELVDIHIFFVNNGFEIASSDRITGTGIDMDSWLPDLLSTAETGRLIQFITQYGTEEELISVLSQSPFRKTEPNAWILVEYSLEAIDEIVGPLIDSGSDRFFLYGEDDRLLYSYPSSRIAPALFGKGETAWVDGKEVAGRGKASWFSYLHEETGRRYEYLADTSDMKRLVSRTAVFILVFNGVSLLLTVLIAFIIANRFYRPIDNIIKIMDSDRSLFSIEGSSDEQKSRDELALIARNLIQSMDHTKAVENELIKNMGRFRQAQIVALQSQINPHFLNNTLNAIYWQAVTLGEGENLVSQSIQSLTGLLSMSLDSSEFLVPVEFEVEQAENYVALIKLRYGQDLKIEWQVDPECYESKVVKMSLQPLIENAIYHGIKPNGGKGVISIRIVETEEGMALTVADDGIGMNRDDLYHLQKEMEDDRIRSGVKIGIVNVFQRFRLAFGNTCSIAFTSNPGQGFQVMITMPKFT